ncbi:hypothetical protein, partial [Lentzea flava]|uniref:hypothetical protein n=1 Tax=Lentzea flava TaxID=103732 RepID=UPI00167148EE
MRLPLEVRKKLVGWRPGVGEFNPRGFSTFAEAVDDVSKKGYEISLARLAQGGFVYGLASDLFGEWATKMVLTLDPVTGKFYTPKEIVEFSGLKIDKSTLIRAVRDHVARVSFLVLPPEQRNLIVDWRPGGGGRHDLLAHLRFLRDQGYDVSLETWVSERFVYQPSTEAIRELAVRLRGEGYAPVRIVEVFGGVADVSLVEAWTGGPLRSGRLTAEEEAAFVAWRPGRDGLRTLRDLVIVLQNRGRSIRFPRTPGEFRSGDLAVLVGRWVDGMHDAVVDEVASTLGAGRVDGVYTAEIVAMFSGRLLTVMAVRRRWQGPQSSGDVSLPDEVRLELTGWRPDPGGGDRFTDVISRIGRVLEGAVSLDRASDGRFVSGLSRGLLSEWSWKMSCLDDPVTGNPYTLSEIREVSGVQISAVSMSGLVQDWRVRMSAVLLPPEVRGAIIKFRPGTKGRSTLPEFVLLLRGRGRGVSLVSSVSPGFVLHPSTEAMRGLAVGMLSEVEAGRPRYTLDQVVGVFGGVVEGAWVEKWWRAHLSVGQVLPGEVVDRIVGWRPDGNGPGTQRGNLIVLQNEGHPISLPRKKSDPVSSYLHGLLIGWANGLHGTSIG